MNQPKLESLTLVRPNDASRRRFLKAVAYGSIMAMGPAKIVHAAYTALAPQKSLCLVHHHTGETLSLAYYEHGRYIYPALQEISYLLRDYHNGEVYPIDPLLLDQLHDVKLLLGVKKPFQIVSAYRSPETNASLRRHSRGVARHSLHMEGKAIDIRIEGVGSNTIRNAALSLNRGGVGYYPRSNFVHIDTGDIRTWHGY
jgi:uncharacterized protein YcbK (DUF882 family)